MSGCDGQKLGNEGLALVWQGAKWWAEANPDKRKPGQKRRKRKPTQRKTAPDERGTTNDSDNTTHERSATEFGRVGSATKQTTPGVLVGEISHEYERAGP